MRIDLNNLLMEYECPNADCIQEETITNSKLSFLQLRDFLIRSGKILHEDKENEVYVASLRVGGLGNTAVVAMQLRDSKLTIAGFAKEGLIKQNLCNKAINKIKDTCQEKKDETPNPKKKIKKLFLYFLICVAIIIVGTVGLLFGEVQQTREATIEYNKAVNAYNEQANLYNEAVNLTSIDNISGLPVMLETLNTESEGFIDNLFGVFGPNDKDTIVADTKTIQDMTDQAQNAVALLKQITAPTGDWVIERLSTVEKITDTQAVTNELDPDGMLGKEGAYTACIYFTVSDIDPNEIVGDTVVAKGTDAGGAVEVYSTFEDAEARCEYLAGFDGTVLYSGSYAIVGTTVIRTSYKLTNEQQMALTNAITIALTSR